MTKRRVMVTGAFGMLAGHVIEALSPGNAEIIAAIFPGSGPNVPHPSVSHPLTNTRLPVVEFDITDPAEVDSQILKARPDVIINCAAYTAVDQAQQDYNLAFRVNAIGPKNLACAARTIGASFVHISSDYVFDGHHRAPRTPWTEGDIPSPCGLYGESKRYGDELVLAHYPERSTILRTSWLHGLYGPNFVDTILRVSAEKEELKVVNDQFGSPTWAGWLAEVIARCIDNNNYGLFHASSRGDITWFDFATEIVRLAGTKAKVGTQTTAELNRPAPRPAYSTLSTAKLEAALQIVAPDWREGLRQHLRARGLLN